MNSGDTAMQWDSEDLAKHIALSAENLAFGDAIRGREELLRCLDAVDRANDHQLEVLEGLCTVSGLYPYMTPGRDTTTRTELARALHSPPALASRGIVFHTEQAGVLAELREGRSVVLSAPTSFGKSLIIDAYIGERELGTVVVIVPTLALLDETRRRLQRTCPLYTVLTHAERSAASNTIYVLTAERAAQLSDLSSVRFFVIDEFYKLTDRDEDDRYPTLNLAFQRLVNTRAQYLMVGPSVPSFSPDMLDRLGARWIHSDVSTVATDVVQDPTPDRERPARAARLLEEYGDSTIVFAKSQAQIRKILDEYVEGARQPLGDSAFGDWLAVNYASDWYVANAARHGIGVHHARLPRAVAHQMIRLFNDGSLGALIVTSSFIEGVNTRAQRIIVADNRIAQRKYDHFTYTNIIGRAGRFKQHLVGTVHLLAEPPATALFEVNLPILTQPDSMSDEMASLVSPEEARPSTKMRQKALETRTTLPLEVLSANRGLSVAGQEAAAKSIREAPRQFHSAMDWSGSLPDSRSVKLLAPYLFDLTGSSGSVRSAKQLAALINMFRHQGGDVRAVHESSLRQDTEHQSDIEQLIDFSRQYLQYKLPNAVGALERIAVAVGGLPPRAPSLAPFAAALERQFAAPYTSSLEEYGLPAPLFARLTPHLRPHRHESLDSLLRNVLELDAARSGLSAVETGMLRDVQDGIAPPADAPLW